MSCLIDAQISVSDTGAAVPWHQCCSAVAATYLLRLPSLPNVQLELQMSFRSRDHDRLRLVSRFVSVIVVLVICFLERLLGGQWTAQVHPHVLERLNETRH